MRPTLRDFRARTSSPTNMDDQGESRMAQQNPDESDDTEYEYSSSDDIEATTSTPYRPFPAVMQAYYQWNLAGLRTFFLCGPSGEDDRLFALKIHTGYSGRAPLGVRPGIYLYNGPSTKHPLMAACGDESPRARSSWGFNLNSIILMPARKTPGSFVEANMRAHTMPGRGVAFAFEIEVGLGWKFCREKFEWRKIAKKERDEETKEGGFYLVRLEAPKTTTGESSYSQGESASSSSTQAGVPAVGSGQEVVAVFSWTRTITNLKHPANLRLTGSALAGTMGDRFTLMVIMTVLKLWLNTVNGKATWPVVAAAEKIRGAGDKLMGVGKGKGKEK
ncbi:hypothetical protein F4780DRAFT_88865 [Xylariomycetidae sp. FL0641]|nr:hypothetical protein F4780DRAFT_88865 [Xylariomycetidae sp. FL0641]